MSGYVVIIVSLLLWHLSNISAIQGFTSQLSNATLHRAMPALFALDDYAHCLSRPHGHYCVLDLNLANVPGHLYDYIMEYSAVRNKHFNRARLRRGVCVSERCNLDSRRALTSAELLSCMNRTVFHKSGVQVGQVKIHFCHSVAKSSLAPPDTLDKSVAILLLMLVLMVAAGTIHDQILETGLVKENRYLMAFSASKNWQILKNNRTSKDLEMFPALQGMRFLSMLIVIIIHEMMTTMTTFSSNPEFLEQAYDHPLLQKGINVLLIIQTFFVMTGFLLMNSFIQSPFPKRFTLGDFNKFIFVRYMRYLAADTQLYAAGLVLIMAVCRYPQRARLLFGSVLVVSLAVPALQTYLQDLQPVRVSFFPETVVSKFVDNKTFINAYMSAHSNWTGFTLGMLTAYIHHQTRKNGWDLRNSTVLRGLFYASLPMALGALSFGSEYHSRAASRLESVAFNVLNRNIFAAAMCVFTFGCINKCDKVLRGCVEWVPLQPLGRLSFCATMVHTLVLRTYFGHLPGLIHLSLYTVLMDGLGTSVMSFVLATVLFLLVEAPFEQLRKLLFSYKKEHLTENGQRSKFE